MNADKTSVACQAIRDLAQELEPAAKLPTINELCSSLGISRFTLDRALGRLERQGVIVRRHGSGIFAASEPQRQTIAVLLGVDPFAMNMSHYYRLFVEQVARRCEAADYDIKFYIDYSTSARQERTNQFARLKKDILAGAVQGILCPLSSGPERNAPLRRLNVPMLTIDDSTHSGIGVALNYPLVINLGVQMLSERGCKKIGIVNHAYQDKINRYGNEKLLLFKERLRGHGLPFCESWCFMPSQSAEDQHRPDLPTWEECAYHGIRQMFEADRPEDEKPDGLLFMDDLMARGALVALQRQGVPIGSSLHIATSSNKYSPALLGHEQNLIRFEFDPLERADRAFDVLLQMMKGKPPKPSLTICDPEVIVEQSMDAQEATRMHQQLDPSVASETSGDHKGNASAGRAMQEVGKAARTGRSRKSRAASSNFGSSEHSA